MKHDKLSNSAKGSRGLIIVVVTGLFVGKASDRSGAYYSTFSSPMTSVLLHCREGDTSTPSTGKMSFRRGVMKGRNSTRNSVPAAKQTKKTFRHFYLSFAQGTP